MDSATLHHWVTLYSSELKAINVLAKTGLSGLQEVENLKISRQSKHEVGTFAGLSTGRIYHHEIFLILIFIRCCVYRGVIVSPEGLNQRKIPMTSSGIEHYRLEMKKGIVPCELCRCTRKENVCENWLIRMKREERRLIM